MKKEDKKDRNQKSNIKDYYDLEWTRLRTNTISSVQFKQPTNNPKRGWYRQWYGVFGSTAWWQSKILQLRGKYRG